MLNKIKLSTAMCGILLVLSLGYFIIALGLKNWSAAYAPGPGFIPRWASGAMVLLCVFALIQSFKEKGPVLSEIFTQRPYGKDKSICMLGCAAVHLVLCGETRFCPYRINRVDGDV